MRKVILKSQKDILNDEEIIKEVLTCPECNDWSKLNQNNLAPSYTYKCIYCGCVWTDDHLIKEKRKNNLIMAFSIAAVLLTIFHIY